MSLKIGAVQLTFPPWPCLPFLPRAPSVPPASAAARALSDEVRRTVPDGPAGPALSGEFAPVSPCPCSCIPVHGQLQWEGTATHTHIHRRTAISSLSSPVVGMAWQRGVHSHRQSMHLRQSMLWAAGRQRRPSSRPQRSSEGRHLQTPAQGD